jgi:hypothetical protein
MEDGLFFSYLLSPHPFDGVLPTEGKMLHPPWPTTKPWPRARPRAAQEGRARARERVGSLRREEREWVKEKIEARGLAICGLAPESVGMNNALPEQLTIQFKSGDVSCDQNDLAQYLDV